MGFFFTCLFVFLPKTLLFLNRIQIFIRSPHTLDSMSEEGFTKEVFFETIVVSMNSSKTHLGEKSLTVHLLFLLMLMFLFVGFSIFVCSR